MSETTHASILLTYLLFYPVFATPLLLYSTLQLRAASTKYTPPTALVCCSQHLLVANERTQRSGSAHGTLRRTDHAIPRTHAQQKPLLNNRQSLYFTTPHSSAPTSATLPTQPALLPALPASLDLLLSGRRLLHASLECRSRLPLLDGRCASPLLGSPAEA